MRRILMVLLTTVIILVAIIFLVTQGGILASVTQHGKDAISLIQTLLQMVAVALGLALVVFILIQYALYIHPRRFIFQGFSNASKLVEAEELPLDLDMLAQEELVHQFKVLYSQWEKYSGVRKPDTSKRTSMLAGRISWKKYSGDRKPDSDTLLTDGLLFEDTSSSQDIKKFLSIEELTKDNKLLDDLKEVIQTLKDSEDVNLMNLVGEIAPEEVTPVMKFIEAFFPPHTIKATGHLQWSTEKAGKAGVTFELVDLGSRRNLMVRTLWQSLKKMPTSTEEQLASKSSTNGKDLLDGSQLNQKQPTSTHDDKTSLAAVLFIDLLKPAMHWLALMFWEQRMIANVPYKNYMLRKHEKRRKAQILYVLGAMYYASANQFPDYDNFFCQLAVEHFRKASTIDPSWYLPDLYLANLYSFKALESSKEMHEKLIREAQGLYEQALEHTTRANVHTRLRIILAKALAELASGIETKSREHIKKATQEVESLKKQIDPADFDPDRADCAGYLYNLAIWYELAYDNFIGIPNVIPREEARRYLAYSLIRSQELWDKVEDDESFKSMREEGDLEILKEELNKKLSEEHGFDRMTGEPFKTEIGKILEKVDQMLKRGV